MTYRLAKKRTLERAGFAHVSGWLPEDEAEEVSARIKAAEPKVNEALDVSDSTVTTRD